MHTSNDALAVLVLLLLLLIIVTSAGIFFEVDPSKGEAMLGCVALLSPFLLSPSPSFSLMFSFTRLLVSKKYARFRDGALAAIVVFDSVI